ncbi:MAG: chalcone isomerase family protein [Pseudomonadota bacterium]
MKRRTFSQALALGTLACAVPRLFAQTAEAPGTTTAPAMAPEDMRAELKDLLPDYRLIGKQRLTYWGFQVYDARLWALPGFKKDSIASQPFALELAYLRDFNAMDVAERSITEMRRSAAISEAQAKAWIAEMVRVYPDFKKGDRVTGINKPGVGAAYLVNGKSTGEIRDVEFARLFFGIWLSPKTSEPQLRSALLAGAA